MHRFLLIQTSFVCISILLDAYDNFGTDGACSSFPGPPGRPRATDAGGGGRRDWLHRPGAAAAALAASVGHDYARDLLGDDRGAAPAGPRASLERLDHAARRGHARPRRRRGLPGVAGYGGGGTRAAAGECRSAHYRSLGRVPAARRSGPRALVSGNAP